MDAHGTIRTHDNWVAPGGKVICTDERTLRFHATADARMIDFAITIHARPDAPLTFGDNKDGTMALRLAQWMTMPHKNQGGGASITDAGSNVASISTSAGHIVNSTGLRDGAVWGKRADWAD